MAMAGGRERRELVVNGGSGQLWILRKREGWPGEVFQIASPAWGLHGAILLMAGGVGTNLPVVARIRGLATMSALRGVGTTSCKMEGLLIASGGGWLFIRGQCSARVTCTISTMVVPTVPAYLEAEGDVLRTWAIQRGASIRQSQRIVGLLNVEWMRNISFPPRTYRSQGLPITCGSASCSEDTSNTF